MSKEGSSSRPWWGAVAVAVLVAGCVLLVPSAAVAQTGVSLQCDKATAVKAVKSASVRSAFKRAFPGRNGRSFWTPTRRGALIGVFHFSEVQCYDLTGDGEPEMIVTLGCCTVSSPDPWLVFRASGGRWVLAYSRIPYDNWGVKASTFGTFSDGQDHPAVEEKIPVYRRGDGNCCPSSFRYVYTVFDDTRFVRGFR